MIRIAPHVVWQDVPGELVLYDQRGNAYHALDDSGSAIWRLIAGGNDVTATVDALVQTYDAPADRIETDVRGFIADARAKGLLDDADTAP